MTVTSSYNEGFDDRGHVRPAYQAFHCRTGYDPFSPSGQTADELTNAPLGDRYSILPIPLVLDDREYHTVIAAGVAQRALALQALFHDVITGDARVYRHTALPRDLFAVILEQEGLAMRDLASWWEGKGREAVRFTYGPDLVRGPDGRWLILEDNLGCVGGVVDSQLVVERFLQCTGSRLHQSVPHGSDLARAVREFLARVPLPQTSAAVLAVLEDECSSIDPEAARKRQVLEALGIRVFTRTPSEDPERLGLSMAEVSAIVNFSTGSQARAWSPADPVFGRHDVPLMTAPGIAALGNKALLPFMDDIVAFYSSGKPILRSAETHSCRAMMADPAEWVLKRTNGCQGREVHFLDRLSEVERRTLHARLGVWGTRGAIVQRRVDASCVTSQPDAPGRGFQVELRPFAFVIGESRCVMGEHISGRAFRNTDGRGLGNMSQGAYYLPVVREPTSVVASAVWSPERGGTRNPQAHANAKREWGDPIAT